MAIRCKFHCTSIEANKVRFEALYDETLPEDQRFAQATPWGHLECGIDNPKALEQIELGKSYYLDLIPAPAP